MTEIVNLEVLSRLMQELAEAPTVLEHSTSQIACWGSKTPFRFGSVAVEPLLCTGRLLFCRWFTSEDAEVVAPATTESFETFGVLEGSLGVVTTGAENSVQYGQAWTSIPGEKHLLRIAKNSRGWLVSIPPNLSFLSSMDCGACRLKANNNCPNSDCLIILPVAELGTAAPTDEG